MNPIDAASLRAPFPPDVIGKLPRGGVLLDFVGHAAVTDRLLQADPEWTWEPLAYTPEGLPLEDKGGLWIKLTVCGVTRLGYGDGPDPKQRIGDAIRNAAMRFGVALDRWAKEDLWAMHVETDPEWMDTQREAITNAPAQGALDVVAEHIRAAVADGRVASEDRIELSALWQARRDALIAADGGQW